MKDFELETSGVVEESSCGGGLIKIEGEMIKVGKRREDVEHVGPGLVGESIRESKALESNWPEIGRG